jgi:hypothetical protein
LRAGPEVDGAAAGEQTEEEECGCHGPTNDREPVGRQPVV